MNTKFFIAVFRIILQTPKKLSRYLLIKKQQTAVKINKIQQTKPSTINRNALMFNTFKVL